MLTRSRPNLSVSTVAPPARLRPRKGPESIVRAFEGIGAAWETEAFEVRDVLEQEDKVAMFGSFTYRGRKSGVDITSPFSLLAKIKDGKIFFVQFLEDTFGTSGTLGRPRT